MSNPSSLDHYINELGMTPSEALDSAVGDAYADGYRAGTAAAAVKVEAAAAEITRPIREALAGNVEAWLYRLDGSTFIRWGRVEQAVGEAIATLACQLREAQP